MMLEVQKDLLQELLGQMVTLGDVGDDEGPILILPGQDEEGAKGISGFLREHESKSFIRVI
jgi:hypothetical protein